MAKVIRHDYGAIHKALNEMIIAEVKAALELLPDKRMVWDGTFPLCHVILSPDAGYVPRDVHVMEAGLDGEHGGMLYVTGYNDGSEFRTAINWFEDETDWHDVTDFGYLLDQIAERLEGEETYNLPNKSVLTAGCVTEFALKQAVDKTVTV